MTFGRWYKLYRHYQNHHDLTVKGITYADLRKQQDEDDGLWVK